MTVVAWSIAAVLLGGTVPSPLYPFHVATLGLIPFLITVVFAVYALGTLAALVLFGGLSDRVGGGRCSPGGRRRRRE